MANFLASCNICHIIDIEICKKNVEIIDLKLSFQLQHMSAIQFSYEPASLPSRFDARQVDNSIINYHYHYQSSIFASLPSRFDARQVDTLVPTINMIFTTKTNILNHNS